MNSNTSASQEADRTAAVAQTWLSAGASVDLEVRLPFFTLSSTTPHKC